MISIKCKINHYFFIIFFFLAIPAINAQKLITEGDYEKGNKPRYYSINENNVLTLFFGSKRGLDQRTAYRKAIQYYPDGKEKMMFDDGDFDIYRGSLSGSTLMLAHYRNMAYSYKKYQFFSEEGLSPVIEFEKVEDGRKNALLTDQYLAFVHNEKGKYIDLKKDNNLKLSLRNIRDGTLNTFSINTIPKDRADEIYGYKFKRKSKKVIPFVLEKGHNNSIAFVTKTLRNKNKEVNIYIQPYSENGDALNEVTLNLKAKNGFTFGEFNNSHMSFSVSSKSISGSNKTTQTFLLANYFSINDLQVALENDEYFYYVYGFLRAPSKKDVTYTYTPTGMYVYKFNSIGEEVWSTFKRATVGVSKNSMNPYDLSLSLDLNRDYVLLSSHVQIGKKIKSSGLELDKTTGAQNAMKNSQAERNVMIGGIQGIEFTYFIKAHNKLREYPKVAFTPGALTYLKANEEIRKYVKGISRGKKKVFLEAESKENGVWLIETDNKTYYKVNFFED